MLSGSFTSSFSKNWNFLHWCMVAGDVFCDPEKQNQSQQQEEQEKGKEEKNSQSLKPSEKKKKPSLSIP